MKKILLVILLLSLTLNCQASEVLSGENYQDEASVLNEELRKIFNEIENSNNSFNSSIDSVLDTIAVKYIYFLIPDDVLLIGSDKIGRIYVDFSGTITEVQASVKTAPTGADLIADININGSTIWSTQANRITISASGYTATQTTFNTTTFSSGDYFTIDLDQVGSTVAGAKLVVRLKVVKT
ncbi:MAG: hypothetical protein WC998_09375 [Candidatus Paceibacterota bacterium]|jgi:hypothetical protein